MKILINTKCLKCGKIETCAGKLAHGVPELDSQSVEEEFENSCGHNKYTGDDSHEILTWQELN